jgi:hypothetical protein
MLRHTHTSQVSPRQIITQLFPAAACSCCTAMIGGTGWPFIGGTHCNIRAIV